MTRMHGWMSGARWWRLLLTLALLLTTALAQAQTYAYRSTTFSWVTPSASATTVSWAGTCTGYPGGDDDFAVVSFPGGFTFPFNGSSRSSVRVLSNGMLQFGPDAGLHRDYTNQALPEGIPNPTYSGCASAVPTEVLMIYWTDINTYPNKAGAYVKYELLGTAPNRRFVVTWLNVYLYGSNSTKYSFQAILNEDGTFVYQYSTGSSDGSGATVGVQVSSSDYTQYAYNQTFIDPTNGTAILWYLSSIAPAEIGQYRFDEASWSGTANEILDTSGNDRHGVRVGSAVTTTGKICRAASIPANTSSTQDAAALGINPRTTLPSSGSIAFWYKDNSKWATGAGDLMLFDASGSSSARFFLSKKTNGKLHFEITDSNGTSQSVESSAQSFAAGTWVHVAVSWYLNSSTNRSVLQVFINGTKNNLLRFSSSGALNANLATLYMGDSRQTTAPTNGSLYSANGLIDEVHIYDFDVSEPQIVQLMNDSRSNCSTLDHFMISVPASATTCDAAAITISAHDIAENLVALTGTTVNLSTSTGHGSWSKVAATGTLTNSGSSNGVATYIMNNEGSVILGFSDTVAETVNFNVAVGTLNENTGSHANHDPDLVITDCGGQFEACDGANSSCTPSRARLFTKLVGNAVALKMIRVNTSNAVDTSFTGKAVTVDLVASSTVGASRDATTNCPASYAAISGSSQSLTFTNGAASGTLLTAAANATAYRDVRVRFQYSSTTYCATDAFAIRPQGFSFLSTLTNQLTYPGQGTPSAVAGSTFAITAVGGSGYVGTPTLDAAKVSSCMASSAAADAGDGSCPNAATTTALSGAFTVADSSGNAAGSSFVYNDVGGFMFQQDAVSDSSFTSVDLANSDCVSGSSSNTAVSHPSDSTLGNVYGCNIGHAATGLFGRFYPDHFTLTAASITQACNSFSYIDQPAVQGSFTLTARTSSGADASRYLGGTVSAIAIRSEAPAGNLLGSTVTPAFSMGNWGSGTMVGTLTNAAYTQTTRTPVVPVTDLVFGVAVSDPDDRSIENADLTLASAYCTSACTYKGLTTTPASAASAGSNPYLASEFRYGRLRLIPRYGTTSGKVNMTGELQYWTTRGFVRNSSDSCTVLPLASLVASALAGGTVPTLSSMSAASAGALSIGLTPQAAGRYKICADLDGSTVRDASCAAGTPAALPYLQGNWGDASVNTRDPYGEVRFGRYINPGGAVFQRESF